MEIIVGLGNPGDKYKETRHNVGFMVTGELASKHNIAGKIDAKFNSIIGKGVINDKEVLIVQPLTYMNLSGQAISKVLNWYKIEPTRLLVVFDDVSLEIGRIRFRPSGSDGGHNGIRSIIDNLGGFKDFSRLKIGIGPDPGSDIRKTYVLQKFTKPEKNIIDKVVPVCIEGIEYYLKEGIEKAQNKYNNTNVADVIDNI
ncbi:MAG: Peptidyl-tRNA hydrolase [uncultured bacterium]|nr:MAG: Peptidyl-tRNA hydrolase [uncultured bacterium]HBH19215.1 aminoacyl-tRNA hydrolase [Cyanobacteria bacterium UBA9579]